MTVPATVSPGVGAPVSAAVNAAASPFFGVDPVLVGIILVLLLVVFALFLFVRKTLVSFSEGMRDGRRK
mgnify:CR=1 FL=1